MTTRRDVLRGSLAMGVAGLAWTTQVHRWFVPVPSNAASPGGDERSATARAALATLLARVDGGPHRASMRRVNPEWDLLERMIGGLALACGALRDPASAKEIGPALRRLALATDAAARERGQGTFLLPYAARGRWRGSERSLFVDGEIALLLGAGLMVEPHDAVAAALTRRLTHVRATMEASPLGSGESYPDECWTYCNTTALAALRMGEVLLGQDHGEVARAFVDGARRMLVHPETGLLISAYTAEGRMVQPPEGSSLWWSAHALRLVDAELARDEYTRTRAALARTRLGFAYALEWPPGVEQRVDVDSGGIVPGLGASPASSGLALVASRSFGDESLFRALWASVELAGFSQTEDGRWRMRAGNAVGDAVAAYALVQGPVWHRLGAS